MVEPLWKMAQFPQKQSIATRSSNFLGAHNNWRQWLETDICTPTQRNVIHISKKVEATQMPLTAAQNVTGTYNGMLFSLTKEGNLDKCYNGDEPEYILRLSEISHKRTNNSTHKRFQEWSTLEKWASKNWCFRTVMLEQTLESPLIGARSNQQSS